MTSCGTLGEFSSSGTDGSITESGEETLLSLRNAKLNIIPNMITAPAIPLVDYHFSGTGFSPGKKFALVVYPPELEAIIWIEFTVRGDGSFAENDTHYYSTTVDPNLLAITQPGSYPIELRQISKRGNRVLDADFARLDIVAATSQYPKPETTTPESEATQEGTPTSPTIDFLTDPAISLEQLQNTLAELNYDTLVSIDFNTYPTGPLSDNNEMKISGAAPEIVFDTSLGNVMKSCVGAGVGRSEIVAKALKYSDQYRQLYIHEGETFIMRTQVLPDGETTVEEPTVAVQTHTEISNGNSPAIGLRLRPSFQKWTNYLSPLAQQDPHNGSDPYGVFDNPYGESYYTGNFTSTGMVLLVEQKLSFGSDGYTKAWINGDLIMDATGPTIVDINDGPTVDFKLGNYDGTPPDNQLCLYHTHWLIAKKNA
ncbi:MAG: hypothetical protein R3A45_09895 [Bdellovibrionota bacterium]